MHAAQAEPSAVPFHRWLTRIPGGMMLIPLLVGAVLGTIFPTAAKVDVFKASFTGGLLTGALALLGAFYVCLGSTIEIRNTGYVLGKGASLWAAKILTAAALAAIIRLTAPDQNHLIFGFSALAVVAAFSDTNGGLYMALVGQLGARIEDAAAYSIMSLESGPFFTMLILGVVGLANFPLIAFVFAILPLVAGMIIGALDPQMRAFLRSGVDILIPFFALALGFGIDLHKVVTAGFSGILLGIGVVVVTGIVLVIADRLTGGNGIAGIAASSTAGNAAAVPLAVSAAFPGYLPIVAAATVQISAAVIVTAILTPILTAWYAGRVSPRGTRASAAAPQPAP